MKHDWEIIDEGPANLLNDPLRRCKNCGKEQRKVTLTDWMRVTGYQWSPLVGRCKGLLLKKVFEKEENENG